MEKEILEKINNQEEKLEAIYQSVEKTRKYFLWTFIATIVTFVLPLIVLLFLIPWFLKTITSVYSLGV